MMDFILFIHWGTDTSIQWRYRSELYLFSKAHQFTSPQHNSFGAACFGSKFSCFPNSLLMLLSHAHFVSMRATSGTCITSKQ